MSRFCISIQYFCLSLSVCFCCVTPAFADRVVVQEGKNRTITGTVVMVSPDNVAVDVRGERQEIPASIVVSTTYDNEPSALGTIRGAVVNGRLQEALDAATKLDPKDLKTNEMKQDYDYFVAAAKTQLLLTGRDGSIEDAGKSLLDYLRNHKSSYHYYSICELYGDLMVQQGRFEDAKKSYGVLSQSSLPEYSLKATVLSGMAHLAEKKTDDARKNFESVLASTGNSERTRKQKNIARVGLALCLVAEKKYDSAIMQLDEMTGSLTGEENAFQALLYNSLGFAYSEAGKPQEAILAYLHTDLLFSSARNEHIQALQELSKLWRKTERRDRAEYAQERLKMLYHIGTGE